MASEMQIDDINIKIIGYLLEDARKNFVDISREVGISKNAVWSRFSKMSQAGIVTGATVQINYKKLGYDCVGTLLMDVDPSQVEKISQYIKKRIPDVFGPFTSASKYNLRAVVTLKTISELGNIKEELRRKLAINEIGSSLWTDVWFTSENLTLIPNRAIEFKDKESEIDNSKFDADETDLKIVRELAKNSRISFRDLSKQLSVSTDTISRRYEKLKENHIIVPRLQFDPKKIGYSAMAHFYLRLMPQYDINKIINEILTIPDVIYTMKCTGDHNLGVMLMVKNIQDMIKTGDKLSMIAGLKIIETVTNPIANKWPLARTYTSTLSRKLPNHP